MSEPNSLSLCPRQWNCCTRQSKQPERSSRPISSSQGDGVYFERKYRLLIYGPLMINRLSEPVFEKDFGDIPLLRSYMVECMRRKDGVGLAAPQVGLFKQFVVIEHEKNEVIDLINPTIERMYGREQEDYESCLSIPPDGNECLVPRLETVHVEASTTKFPGVRQEFVFTGELARIVQHEIDHLTGTFFVDRVSLSRKREVIERFEWWKKSRISQIRYSQEGNNGNVDAGVVAARSGKSRLS